VERTYHLDYDLGTGEMNVVSRATFDNGCPMSVYHGLVVRLDLPLGREYDEDEVIAHAREEIGGRLEQLRDLGSVEWDGSNWFWRHHDADAAEEAADLTLALEEEVAEWPLGTAEWDALDWFEAASPSEEFPEGLLRHDVTAGEVLAALEDYEPGPGPHGEEVILVGLERAAEVIAESIREEYDDDE